ncbi:MAG: TonB-dependent receptor [Opitutaceae bacterium]|nr:TonB-dependent receptor [Cytophagales bacterium]
MKKTLLISFLILSVFVAKAQQGIQVIRGSVKDQQSKYQIPGAVITIIGSDPLIGTTTDENGDFRLENVPLGRHNLKISYLGYSEKIIPNVLVQQGKQTALLIELEELVLESEEVVITAETDKTQAINEMSTVSTRQFSREEAARYAGSLNDPSRMASNYAGVSGANDSRNDIVIRGNSPTGLLWRMEGLPIPNPNHFGSLGTTGGPVSILNYNQLANSDFMTGAFPAEYGNATSGVFDLQMRSGNNKKREYLGQIGLNGFEMGAEGPFSKKSRASYLINYRYSTLSFFKAIGINFGTGQSVPQYQDLSFKVDLPTKKLGRFTLFTILGDSYIEFLESNLDTTKGNANLYGNDGYDIYFRSRMGVSGLNHTIFLNSNTFIKSGISVSGATNAIRSDSLNLKTRTPLDNYNSSKNENRIVGTIQFNKKFSAKNTLHAGTYITNIIFNYDERLYKRPQNEWRSLSRSDGSSILSEIFAQWKHRFSDKLSTNVGLHYQYFAYNNASALEPRMGLKWQFKTKQSLNFGLGLHNQLQPMPVYFISTRRPDGTYSLTNKDLGFTQSSQVILGYDNNISANWRIKLETYFQYLNNVPVETKSSSYSLLNFGADFSNPDVDSLVNKGTGKNYGVELTIERFLSNGFYLLSTNSLFDSKYTGSDGVERNTAFNGRYVQNFLAGKEFKLNRRYTFITDIKLTFAGGKRILPVDLEKSKIKGTQVNDTRNPYVDQLPAYFRPDLKLSMRREGKKITQELVLSLQNVINRQNLFTRNYSRKDGVMKDVYQLGFFPVPQYRVLF